MVHREEHNQNFTIIDNVVLQNVNLSFEARGFFAYLLSLPDDWKFTVRGLVKQTGTSKSVILRLMNELQAEGYIRLTKNKDEAGRFTASSWDVFEGAKTPESPHNTQTRNTAKTEHGENGTRATRNTAKPESGFTEHGENGTIQSTNNNKVLIEQSTKENKGQKRFVPPTVSEVKAYCQERNNGINPEEFIDYYASQGWKKANGRPVVDWKGCVRLWEKDRRKPTPNYIPKAQSGAVDWNEVERMAEQLAGGEA